MLSTLVSLVSYQAPLPAVRSRAGAACMQTKEELAAHSSRESCWVALHGVVYDFSGFLEEHPPGAESILELGGTDGTAMFETVHNEGMLAEFEADVVGKFADCADDRFDAAAGCS